MQGERQAVAVDAGAERAQGVQHGGEGAFAGARVAVERDGAVGQRRGGRDEAHDGAREPAVDGAAAAELAVAADGDALPSTSTGTPSARRAPTMSAVSREAGAPLTDAGPSARAASSSARLVTDFEPGTATTPCTGPAASGADQVTRP